jgi:hypothetical protein
MAIPLLYPGSDFLTTDAIDGSRRHCTGCRDSVNVSYGWRCMGIAVENEGFL